MHSILPTNDLRRRATWSVYLADMYSSSSLRNSDFLALGGDLVIYLNNKHSQWFLYRTRMSKTDRMKQDGQRGPWKGGTALQIVQAEGGWQFAQLWACTTMYRLLESLIGWCIHSTVYKESAVYHFQLLVFSLFLPFCLPLPSMSLPVIPAILWLSQQRMSTDSVNATQWQPAILG